MIPILTQWIEDQRKANDLNPERRSEQNQEQ